MVPCPAFDEFARYAVANPERDFGVHLTLNCDTRTTRWGPVLPRDKVPSLVDSNGYLWSTTEQTAAHAKISEVKMELLAQIEKAHTAGITISHLDHHMFVLFSRPDLLRLYVQLALKFHLPVRYQNPALVPIPSSDSALEFTQVFEEGFQLLRRNNLPTLEEVESANYGLGPAKKKEYFERKVSNLKPGVSEFVIHCADSSDSGEQPPDVQSREADTQIFTSDEMAASLQKHSIHVISWKEVRRIASK